MTCSHVWIDRQDPAIARASYAPFVGLLRRQMKAGTVYHCQNCGVQLPAAALAPRISIDEQVDIFVHRLELLLYRKTGNTWEANQLRAVRALFHDVLAAAALAPTSEKE